jgi:hypothetical protein
LGEVSAHVGAVCAKERESRASEGDLSACGRNLSAPERRPSAVACMHLVEVIRQRAHGSEG